MEYVILYLGLIASSSYLENRWR